METKKESFFNYRENDIEKKAKESQHIHNWSLQTIEYNTYLKIELKKIFLKQKI